MNVAIFINIDRMDTLDVSWDTDVSDETIVRLAATVLPNAGYYIHDWHGEHSSALLHTFRVLYEQSHPLIQVSSIQEGPSQVVPWRLSTMIRDGINLTDVRDAKLQVSFDPLESYITLRLVLMRKNGGENHHVYPAKPVELAHALTEFGKILAEVGVHPSVELRRGTPYVA